MNGKRDGSQEEGGYGIREGAKAYFRQKWRAFLFCGLLFLFVQGYFFLFIQNQQLSSMLLGCRLQGPLLDLQIREVHLPEWVKASIRNGFEKMATAIPLALDGVKVAKSSDLCYTCIMGTWKSKNRHKYLL